MNAELSRLVMRYLSTKIIIDRLSDQLEKTKVTLEKIEADIRTYFYLNVMPEVFKITLYDAFEQPYKVVVIPKLSLQPKIVKHGRKFYCFDGSKYVESFMIEATELENVVK